MPAQGNGIYRFADCELDPRERRLLAQGQPVTLTPKVFDTLVLLVSRAGHVVSKDELTAALWPRGFVHESNLTKHIWLIRRALGDTGDESRYIETVPKLGYRFIEPVIQVDDGGAPVPAAAASIAPDAQPEVALAGAPLDAPAAQELAPVAVRRRFRFVVPAAFIVFAAFVAAVVFAWREVRGPAAAMETGSDNAVAIVDFNNLSGNAKDAWLGPALAEMLATELTAGGRLHAVPDELVRPAHADLAAPMAGGYAPASLSVLHQRLGSDYVLSGSYLVYGDTESPQLRLDIVLQDARSGAARAGLSRAGAVADLPKLVIAAGAALRDQLGMGSLSLATQHLVANAQPPTAEVARHIGFALDALHQYDPARARDEALQAIAQAPGYAPAYVYLAQGWSALGYRAKALAAAKQALANSQGLPEEQRLLIEAQQDSLQGNHTQAADAFRRLIATHPQNPEYRLQFVDALISDGKYDEANTALVKAKGLPGFGDDPRLELVAGDIAAASDNQPAAISHARMALQQARMHGETGLIAEAELQLGAALDQDPQAEPLLHGAATAFRSAGNPHGEAKAWQNLANLQYERNQFADARETYQRAMSIYQGIGDLGGEAAVYDNLARMLWDIGDRDGAETAIRQSLQIARETADLRRQAWNLAALATALSDESASGDVAAMYQEAITLDRQSGVRSHLPFVLSNYADMLRMRGQLSEAREFCVQAQIAMRALNDAWQSATTDFECAQIALDRGEIDKASTGFAAIEKSAITVHDSFDTANSQLMLAQIEMGRRHWTAARDLLRQSLQGWTASKETAGEATADALLALCYAALGDGTARDEAITQARSLREQVTERAEVFEVDIALAELQGEADVSSAGIKRLQTLAEDASKRHWVGLSFEARLAAQRLLDRDPGGSAAAASRRILRSDAQKAGFQWVTQRLADMPE